MSRAPDLETRVAAFLAEHDPATMDRLEFLRAQFDAGLAWVSFPEGLGGLDLPQELQAVVDAALARAGALPAARAGPRGLSASAHERTAAGRPSSCA